MAAPSARQKHFDCLDLDQVCHPAGFEIRGAANRRSARNSLLQQQAIAPGWKPIHIGIGIMAETKKLSVEKALNKLREADELQSKSARREQEMDELDEEIKRMREQRLRLERRQRPKT